MRIYLVDDDGAVLSVLRLLIEDGGLGEITGCAKNALDALEDLSSCHADLVLVDLLMPGMDGIEFVREAKKRFPELRFVMLSQVSSKDMVADAYAAGVEFFITKPINSVEVTSVLQKVSQHLSMSRTMRQVRSLMQIDSLPEKQKAKIDTDASSPPAFTAPQMRALKTVLHRLGLSGDPAYGDILQLVGCLLTQGRDEPITVSQLCARFSSSPKAMEQRIRRAASAGMGNLASLGIEDYANDVFTEYAGTLFNFEQVRKEMNFIRGKSSVHGKVSVKRFLYALTAICSKYED